MLTKIHTNLQVVAGPCLRAAWGWGRGKKGVGRGDDGGLIRQGRKGGREHSHP